MYRYFRCEFIDLKTSDTGFRNVRITDNGIDYPCYVLFNTIEYHFFKDKRYYLMGFMEFTNIESWEQFNARDEDIEWIQNEIDQGNVKFYYNPKRFKIPDNVEIIGIDKRIYDKEITL